MTRPLLFLDVDGTLLPFGGDARTFGDDPNPLLARLDPAHGPRLAALSFDLVWATTWTADANEVLSPRLGLPELPVVDWPEPSDVDVRDERAGLHWKTRTLVAWAAGHPFAWVDDEITHADRAWVAARHPGPALLHRVDPRAGLTGADYATLRAWAGKPT
ncbi:HAD domain-containing protein [Actinophytocola glycyrrhizae]|uniref:HAD domain-containing protein n=1 Tax=Actinophytocola glycyrrhizae TaxID=2044873 RepID=A0ABV9S4W3_9PSEU